MRFQKLYFLIICLALGCFSKDWKSSSPSHAPLASHSAYASQGLQGEISFGTVSGWYPNASIYQLRIGGSFSYAPTWQFGGGIEALGSTLNDSSRFSSARFYAFGRKIWEKSPSTRFLGFTLRIENSQLEYITSTDNPNPNPDNPQDKELRDKLTTPIVQIDMGNTWKVNSVLYLPLGYAMGLSKHSKSRTELSQGISLDLKEIGPEFFAPASLAYLNGKISIPLPGIQKGPQYLLGMTLGF